MPADGHPRRAARGCQRRTLRWLADDPLGPEDAAGDGGDAHDTRLAPLYRRGGMGWVMAFEVHTLMSGIMFGESPRWHENRLWFSDWGAQEVIAVDQTGNGEVILQV